jgi:lysosomal Pro-X carboxypeptidase
MFVNARVRAHAGLHGDGHAHDGLQREHVPAVHLITLSYDGRSDECFQSWGVRPRPHWVTTEYGGHVGVLFQNFIRFCRNQPQAQTFVDLVLHCTIFLQKIEKVLKRFGRNIIFSNGMRDPWSRGG